MMCAQQISNNFDLNDLIEKTEYNIPNTSSVYFDYTIFKLYAHESNYQLLINHILRIFDYCIDTYGEYVVHVNLDSFTVSAAERYKKIIELFNLSCIQNTNYLYTKQLKTWYIYYPPSVIDMIQQILKSVIESEVLNKINVISKKDSSEELKKLLQTI